MRVQNKYKFIVGLYHQNSDVKFEELSAEEEAQRLYKESASCSRALFRVSLPAHDDHVDEKHQQLMGCATAWWDGDGLGVATLLQGQDSTMTPEEIKDELEEGKLPFVPPVRLLTTQICLKLTMQAVFGRMAVTHFGSAPYRNKSLCYYDVKKHPALRKHVALTLDDVPCRFRQSDASELPRIRKLLKTYDAKATFMAIGSWCTERHKQDLISLLHDGHELGNHGMMDKSYEFDSVQDFGNAVDACSDVIKDLQVEAGVKDVGVKWFRAPHGRYTKAMAQELASRNLTNVMCDTYASCPVVADGEFIARFLTDKCQDGSIILLHCPERYVRQWCWTGLVGLLEGLKARNFKVVTVSELTRLAESTPDQE